MFTDPLPTAATAGRRKAVSLHLLLAAAILMTPAASDAQEVGDHVRVTLQDGQVAGEVMHVGDAEFWIFLQEREVHSIRRADILLLERRVTGSRAKEAAIWGGVGLGMLAGVAASSTSPFPLSPSDGADMVAIGFLMGGAIGALLGALVGSAFKWTRWESVAVADGGATPAIGLAVGGGRVGVELGGRLRF